MEVIGSFREVVYYIFPAGVREDNIEVQVYPGVYSVVGAAAFCGGSESPLIERF